MCKYLEVSAIELAAIFLGYFRLQPFTACAAAARRVHTRRAMGGEGGQRRVYSSPTHRGSPALARVYRPSLCARVGLSLLHDVMRCEFSLPMCSRAAHRGRERRAAVRTGLHLSCTAYHKVKSGDCAWQWVLHLYDDDCVWQWVRSPELESHNFLPTVAYPTRPCEVR